MEHVIANNIAAANLEPHDLPAAHIIKITNGKMHEIEALGFFAPYRSPTGWSRE